MERKQRWVALAGTGLLVATAAYRLRPRVARFAVVEDSMQPALRSGDFVLAFALAHPFRGDLVVFEHPQRPGFHLVKRVIGLPGETVEIAEHRVQVDGAILIEPWARGVTEPAGTWVLGPGEIFVLGDQRTRSVDDGRTLGSVPIAKVPWRIAFRYWPLGRIGPVGL